MRWAIRIFGGLNILPGLLGMYYFAYLIEIHWRKWPGNPSAVDWAVFVALSSVTTFLVLYLGYLGVRLIRVDSAALRQVCLVFLLGIIYFFADVCVNWIIFPLWKSSTITVGFWGIAAGPLVPQIITGYPLIGFVAAIALILFQRRCQRVAHTTAG